MIALKAQQEIFVEIDTCANLRARLDAVVAV